MPKAKIVIIHNDVRFIKALQVRLAMVGYVVQGVSQGIQIFKVVASVQPDLILLDDNFDNPTWPDILKRLRQASSTRELKYVLLVRDITPAMQQQAKIHLVSTLIKKPLVLSNFLQTIEPLCAK